MKPIIIGSTAIARQIPEFREPKDWDYMWYESITGVDTIVVPKIILEQIPHGGDYVATLSAVYTIKCSHLGWDIKWHKHKRDVLYLKSIGCELIEPLYESLVGYWKDVNGNKPYLNMYKKKDDFFNDHVQYIYDHDYLHELVALPNKPVYTECLQEGQEVFIDQSRFNKLSTDVQLKMFKEEITVIAMERWLIPPRVIGRYTWTEAYHLALHKTVVSLTKNWATDFLVRNLDYFIKPDFKFFKNALNTLKEGKIIMSTQVKNAEEIRDEIIEAYNSTNPRWAIDEGSWYGLDEIKDFGEFKSLDQEGGGEGGGEYCHHIFSWKNQAYKLTYSYYSHVGYDFDYCGLYTVEPEERVVTEYV